MGFGQKTVPGQARAGNTVDIIHRNLRCMVLEFQLKPGQRLNEQHLCQALEVGRTPLREAINRLVAENLVIAQPNRGFYIRDVDPDEIAQLFEMREVVEAAAVVMAAERATDAELLALRNAWQRVLEDYRTADAEELLSQDVLFHSKVAQLSRNLPLARLVADVNERIYLVRWAALQVEARKSTFDEHALIVEALVARDGPKAEALMRAHIKQRTHALRRAIADGLLHVMSKSNTQLKAIDFSEEPVCHEG